MISLAARSVIHFGTANHMNLKSGVGLGDGGDARRPALTTLGPLSRPHWCNVARVDHVTLGARRSGKCSSANSESASKQPTHCDRIKADDDASNEGDPVKRLDRNTARLCILRKTGQRTPLVPNADLAVQLCITVALEHFTAIFAYSFWKRPRTQTDGLSSRVKD
ncbi:MAG: hypothetical protein JWO15_3281 [Sphingomonadales bacterium]|nr:hypothetical protein [Sphingomonadales bacterium]